MEPEWQSKPSGPGAPSAFDLLIAVSAVFVNIAFEGLLYLWHALGRAVVRALRPRRRVS